MKQKLLLLVALLVAATTAWADVEINETNFPDANFRAYLTSQTYGSDGVITDAELSGVTSIIASSRNISDLKGIEYFTALKRLYCSRNLLTSLNVSVCKALTNLKCDNNQLTSLDVSKNTALTSLDCYENQLTSLDVSKNTALTHLDCYENQLTSLDVSKNTALTRLDCSVNQLTSLDVSKNTALTDLSCSQNQLTSLDVSKNTALTYFSCSSNQLTSLDVSKNTALGYLGCSQNQLTTLDVSKNTALYGLSCYLNQIKGVSMDALVTSLPTISYGVIVVICNEGEQNVMTTTQVAAAKAKGWEAYYYDNSRIISLPYAGSEPSAINIVTASEAIADGIWFSIDGRRIDGRPSQKGIYIINGKKVVVK